MQKNAQKRNPVSIAVTAAAHNRVMNRDEDADELNIYLPVQEMGCRYCSGSDTHTAAGPGWAKRNAERIIKLPALTEEDTFIL